MKTDSEIYHESDEPAFPIPITEAEHKQGMTLRDYFAAKALQGILAKGHEWGANEKHLVANVAYEFADAMLKERSK